MSEINVLEATTATAPSPFDDEFASRYDDTVSNVPQKTHSPAEIVSAAKDILEPMRKVVKFTDEHAEGLAALSFVRDHRSDYYACPQNQAAIEQYLAETGLPLTRDNLETAFNDLSAGGALVQRPIEPVQPRPVTPRRKVVTRSTQAEAGASGNVTLTEHDIRTLPPDEARARLNHAARQMRPVNRVRQSLYEPGDDFFSEQALAERGHIQPCDAA